MFRSLESVTGCSGSPSSSSSSSSNSLLDVGCFPAAFGLSTLSFPDGFTAETPRRGEEKATFHGIEPRTSLIVRFASTANGIPLPRRQGNPWLQLPHKTVRCINAELQLVGTDAFPIVLHNCGAQVQLLPGILETGIKSFHFGAPMSIRAALDEVPGNVVLCGNLDPSNVFVRSRAEDPRSRAAELLRDTANHRNFVLSSGCDLPPGTPMANLDAFYSAPAALDPPSAS